MDCFYLFFDAISPLTSEFRDNFTLSKTEEYGSAIDSEVPNELGSDEEDPGSDDGEGNVLFIKKRIVYNNKK